MSRQLLCGMGVLAALLASEVRAQPERTAEQVKVEVTSGVVISRGDESLVIRAEEDPQLTFAVREGTELPTPLITGSDVRVEYEILEDGTLSALNVMLNVTRYPKEPCTADETAESDRVQRDGLPESEPESELPGKVGWLPLTLVSGLLVVAGGIAFRRALRHS